MEFTLCYKVIWMILKRIHCHIWYFTKAENEKILRKDYTSYQLQTQSKAETVYWPKYRIRYSNMIQTKN
jgi:hypothetical protein